ncbi:PLDc N-terminal domain-containing protein [Corynebacterium atrinae]|uniref:PLDc N-terminal domain-containing protein n=1 Tax=Corynebacterium atrinae TaxID=1336740 RepID=UPI0025B4D1AF|nr:PLDc N-terminal domain-containing protein [Corynebacterium atrinae]
MSTKSRKFSELSTQAQAGIVVGALVELTAKVGMWIDLSRRPAEQVRGPKWAWAAASFINGFGPAAYWTFGRK